MSMNVRAHIERLNFHSDHRNCAPATAPVLYTEKGEVKLPTKWVVCTVCRGEGTHVNPSIDCGGISSEEFDEDPDFAESYASGAYDVQCNCCGGRTTVQEVDWDRLTPEQRTAYERQLKDEQADRACHIAELRAGA